MNGINSVHVVGHLGQDPDARYMPSGTAVTNLSVATSESWTDKETGEKKESTEWHRVAMFGRVAEVAAEYLRKGSLVYLAGKLRTRKWQDKDGNDRYTTEIIADQMQMLGGRSEQDKPKDEPRPEPAAEDDELPFDDSLPFTILLPTLFVALEAANSVATVAV